jgi:hypothetical protein
MIGLIAAAAVLGAAPADPLEPARQGLVQCYVPDAPRRTCLSIGAYEIRSDGQILNTATVLINPNPAIVMRTVAPVTVKAGAVCGVVTQADIDGASFTYNDMPVDDEQAAKLKAAIGSAMGAIVGHEVCTRFEAEAEHLKGVVTLDGERKPDLDQPLVWVSPAEYRVGS